MKRQKDKKSLCNHTPIKGINITVIELAYEVFDYA